MSCLFDSLSEFVNTRSLQLRQDICDFLEKNPKLLDEMSAEELVKFETDCNLKDYIFKMRQQSTMGGAIEIKAFCMMFNRNVKINSTPNNRNIEFIMAEDLPFVYLKWTGGHYDPVKKF